MRRSPCRSGRAEGDHIFVSFAEELARFAGTDPRLAAIAGRVGAPLRVAVRGRPGVGRRTVGGALDRAGLVVAPGGRPDVVVQVIAETIKPEDSAAIAAADCPVLVVLNKADLLGGPQPIRLSRHCARLAALAGAPIEPMIGLLALAALDNQLDDTLVAALRSLAAAPLDCDDADRFIAAPHRVPRAVRVRLLDTLDRSGTARAVAAIGRGVPAAQLAAQLRRVSGVDTVAGRVVDLGATVRYRRIRDAVLELTALAVTDHRIEDFLARDATAAARMAAAVAVLRAAGVPIDPGDPDDSCRAHLRRARAGQRHRQAPVTEVFRSCATDIVRGSLRGWARAGGRP